MDKTKKLLITLLVVVIVIIAGYFVIAKLNTKENKVVSEANGIRLVKNKNYNYTPRLITSYSEYNALLKEYGADNLVYLTNGDFDNKDYLVDFINYEDNLKIDNIEVEVLENDIKLNYYVSYIVADTSDYYLMYFIPVENKGMFTTIDNINHEFIVSWIN